MSNWLNPDNKFFSTISKAFDVLVLNTLWLLLCVPLPILTIVWIAKTENFLFLILTVLSLLPVIPATTAIYYAMVKTIRRERGYAIKEFFRSFFRNFKQGAILSLLAEVLIVVLYIDFRYAWDLMVAEKSSGSMYFGVFIVVSMLACSMYMYICPILSRFDMKITGILKTAFVMGVRHLLTTILLFVLVIGVILGCSLVLPGIFFLPAVAVLLASFLIEKVFRRYMPEKEETEENEFGEEIGQDKDEWYLE